MLDSIISELVEVSSGIFFVDVSRGRGGKIGTVFTMSAP